MQSSLLLNCSFPRSNSLNFAFFYFKVDKIFFIESGLSAVLPEMFSTHRLGQFCNIIEKSLIAESTKFIELSDKVCRFLMTGIFLKMKLSESVKNLFFDISRDLKVFKESTESKNLFVR